jgi:hypothetical protein
MPTSERRPRKKKSGVKRTDSGQSAKFIKAAKELGLGEDSAGAFERAMDALKRQKGKSS